MPNLNNIENQNKLLEKLFPGFSYVSDSLFNTSAIDSESALGFSQVKIRVDGNYYKLLIRRNAQSDNTKIIVNEGVIEPQRYNINGYEILALPIDAINISYFNLDKPTQGDNSGYQLIDVALNLINNFYTNNPDFKIKMQKNNSMYSIFAISLSEKKVYLLV